MNKCALNLCRFKGFMLYEMFVNEKIFDRFKKQNIDS